MEEVKRLKENKGKDTGSVHRWAEISNYRIMNPAGHLSIAKYQILLRMSYGGPR